MFWTNFANALIFSLKVLGNKSLFFLLFIQKLIILTDNLVCFGLHLGFFFNRFINIYWNYGNIVFLYETLSQCYVYVVYLRPNMQWNASSSQFTFYLGVIKLLTKQVSTSWQPKKHTMKRTMTRKYDISYYSFKCLWIS